MGLAGERAAQHEADLGRVYGVDDGIDFHIHAGALQHRQALRLDAVADVPARADFGHEHLVRLVQDEDVVMPVAKDSGLKQIGPLLISFPAVIGEVGNVLDHDAARENLLKAAPDVGLAAAAGADEQGVGLDAPLKGVVDDDGGGFLRGALLPNQPVQVAVDRPGCVVVFAVMLVHRDTRQHDEGAAVHVNWPAQLLRQALGFIQPDADQRHERIPVHVVTPSGCFVSAFSVSPGNRDRRNIRSP